MNILDQCLHCVQKFGSVTLTRNLEILSNLERD
jgi:hypothetical protein